MRYVALFGGINVGSNRGHAERCNVKLTGDFIARQLDRRAAARNIRSIRCILEAMG